MGSIHMVSLNCVAIVPLIFSHMKKKSIDGSSDTTRGTLSISTEDMSKADLFWLSHRPFHYCSSPYTQKSEHTSNSWQFMSAHTDNWRCNRARIWLLGYPQKSRYYLDCYDQVASYSPIYIYTVCSFEFKE